MITAIIIEDDPKCTAILTKLIHEHCSQSICLLPGAESVETGIRAIKTQKPQLVFLDIELQNKTSFDLLRQLPKIDFDIIFTTAYNNYAVQAFSVSAVDYLLKPVNADYLKKAVEKLQKKRSMIDASKRYEILLANADESNKQNKQLAIHFGNGYRYIPMNSIIMCKGSSNYTDIYYSGNNKISFSRTLKDVEEMLPEKSFFRIHKSYLINFEHVKDCTRDYVIISNHPKIEVAGRRQNEFSKRFMKWKEENNK